MRKAGEQSTAGACEDKPRAVDPGGGRRIERRPRCDFVDTSGTALARLREHLDSLGAAERGKCHPCSAADFIAGAQGSYDILFIDPPFAAGLVDATCAAVEAAGLAGAGALVYIETGAADAPPGVPTHWSVYRDKTAGDVAYRLYEVG